MKKIPIIALGAAFILSGCASPTGLSMSASKPAIDKSALSPKVAEKKYSKIMVIPPSGISRGEFESQIVLFEREFLRHGVTVIAGAVTGKVVLEGASDERKSESAAQLSDLERALVMAGNTGAEAILQIGTFAWGGAVNPARFFITDGKSPFREVAEAEYRDQELADQTSNKRARTFSYSSNDLQFRGRLIDLNGEVVATFDLALPMIYALPRDYHARLARASSAWGIVQENYQLQSTAWTSKSQALAEERMIESVVRKITLAP